MKRKHRTAWVLAGVASSLVALLWMRSMKAERPSSTSVIVQGNDMTALGELVGRVGGTVTHELRVINSVVAELTSDQIDALRKSPEVSRIYANRPVERAEKKTRSLDDMDPAVEPVPTVPAEDEPDPTPVVASENHYPIRVGAHRLHEEGITG